jgi:hypothetical protein
VVGGGLPAMLGELLANIKARNASIAPICWPCWSASHVPSFDFGHSTSRPKVENWRESINEVR